MNNEMVTYTFMKNNVTGNWELTSISLSGLQSVVHGFAPKIYHRKGPK